MKNEKIFRFIIKSLLFPILYLSVGNVYAHTIGENFIAIEAEDTESNLDKWKLITPEDPRYFSPEGGIIPMNETHLEFTGNNINSGPATSPLEYTFVCPKTGEYRVVIRMWQRLLGEPNDKCNDAYVKMAGNFTSASPEYTTEDLQNNLKFYGRGTNTWGVCHKGDGGSNHAKAAILYNLIEGEEYTFTISGRAQRANFDYILFYETSIDMRVEPYIDLAQFNDPIYRPESKVCRTFKAVDFKYKNITGFTNAEADFKDNKAILSIPERGEWAAAQMIYDGLDGIASFQINTMLETDGESSYILKINGEQINEVTNVRIFGTDTVDYTIQTHELTDSLPISNGDTIQIEFNNTTNGLVPEGDTTATSRGRWYSIDMCTSSQFEDYYVNIVEKKVTLEVGQTSALNSTLKLNPIDENVTIQWSSKDALIASVNQNGEVTAVSPGETYIYAQSTRRGLIDSCKVVSNEATISSLDDDMESDVRVYPNPFKNKLVIDLEQGQFQVATLLDVSGKVISNSKIDDSKQIILSPSYSVMPSGVYFLKLLGENASQVIKLERY